MAHRDNQADAPAGASTLSRLPHHTSQDFQVAPAVPRPPGRPSVSGAAPTIAQTTFPNLLPDEAT